jgi:predicted unusual protein kinase regulating ubiquinone biosynthesis (AarF/ABC1/UbiB family)
MLPKITELLASQPVVEDGGESNADREQIQTVLAELTRRPVPADAPRRLWALGGLQGQIALAYLAYWVRSCFRADVDVRERALQEAHLRAAIGLLETMGYLRGAVMKVGQALANLPDILPGEVLEALEQLHFEAPPMHFSLLREHVRNELGDDPEEIFRTFESTAFAAASLGQVHRAVLQSGRDVAVKVQYPGIRTAIRSDFQSLSALLLPARLSKAWDSLKGQFEDVRRVIELETDYTQEARSLRTARDLFRDDDMIVVPRVYDEYSTSRVLTMEYIDGVHIHDFLATNPAQELRDYFGAKIYRASARLYYAGRLLYADPHPGNYLFLADGRLGFIDFGCVRPYAEEERAYCRQLDTALFAGSDYASRVLHQFVESDGDEASGPEYRDLLQAWCRWLWLPYEHEGPFDFGDEEYFRSGVATFSELVCKRYTRGMPMVVLATRWCFGMAAMLYRLRARIDVRAICIRERAAAGWPELQ